MQPPGSPRVLVAPDSFKGTYSAREVADAIAGGLGRFGVAADLCPVADGGEGTVDVLLDAFQARWRHSTVSDPLGRPVTASWALSADGATALIETAAASGIALVRDVPPEPERASTRGTGELIVSAVDAGATKVILGVGGSATTDGGEGAVSAVLERGGLDDAELIVLCDVSTPFESAALIFGPQKGADAATVERLTQRLHRRAAAYPRNPVGIAMTGAAGGLAGGLWAALDATLVSGAEFVLEAVGFRERLDGADAVVIGEGRLDTQSLVGKITGTIAALGGSAGVPVHAVVGSSALDASQLAAAQIASVRVASTVAELRSAGESLARMVVRRSRLD